MTCGNARADETPGFHVRVLAFKDCRIVTNTSPVIVKGSIIVRDGRIAAVGAEVDIPVEADVIDGTGLTIYPGFIDAGATSQLDDTKPTVLEGRSLDTSRYALAGIPSDRHSGLTPEYSAAEHLKFVPAEIDKYRQAGFVATHLLPSGRIVSGRGAIVYLASLPPREITVASSTFATVQMIERRSMEYPSTKMGIHAHLRQTFLDAERHAKHLRLFGDGVTGIDRPVADSVLESFTEIRTGKLRTIFQAGSRDDIERALDFAAEHQLRIAIWGGEQAYRLTDRLKKTETDVIVNVDFGDEPKIEPPKTNDDPFADLPEPRKVREHKLAMWKERVAGLAELHRRGVRFALSSKDGKSPADVLKAVRQAIANGLDRDTALAALTTQPAAILGLEKDLGTIAVGRPACFIALTGPFDNEQSKVRHSIIGGHRYEYNKDAKPVEPTKPGQPAPLQLAGTWSVEIDAAEGKVKGELELSQTDRTLSGRLQSDRGTGRITSGTATEKSFEFVVSIGTGDSAIQLKFDSTGWNRPAPTSSEKREGEKPGSPNSPLSEIGGQLKSPFGASTKWTAKRVEPKHESAVGIQITGIETIDSEPSQPKPSPTSALSPSNVVSSSRAAQLAYDQPVEFPEDRRARPIVTGGNVLIQNGTVLTGTGLTLPNTSVMVKSGVITAIAPDLAPESGMTLIDATGRYLMPGIIDTHSHIMISNGINEYTDSIVCEVRVRDCIDTADPSEYRALAGGVTTARLFHGSANCIGGQDAVVQLKHGTNYAEHLFPDAHSGVKFALGENVKFRSGRFPNTRLGIEATLNRAFFEALDYRKNWMAYERDKKQAGGIADKLLPPRRDLRLEALADILEHRKFIHSHCYRADEILMLLRIAESHGIRVWSLQHVLEGYKIAPEIVKHGASCSTFADWWAYKFEAYDATPQNAALLHEAGANTVIKSDDWELIRHLYLEAAKTVRYGNMPPDAALQAITLSPARELGLSNRIGSIEVGKQADIAIFSGHPLNGFSRCEQTLIGGEVYFTRSKQPSAMSATAAARIPSPAGWTIPKPEERVTRIDLTAANTAKYAITGAMLHPIDADDIPNGILLIEDDRIIALGQNVPLPEGIASINATGLHVYPGMIDAGTAVGLIEIAKVRETSDLAEIGQFQGDLRAGIAVNPDSDLIPVARAGGITTTLCLPSSDGNMTSHERAHGPMVAGQASLIQLAGWTMPEMVTNMEAGLHMIWPRGANRKANIEDLKRHLNEARLYDRTRNLAEEKTPQDAPERNFLIDPRFEAMRPYVKGEKSVFVEAETRQEITEVLQFAEQEKLKIVLCGVTDGWKLVDQIKAANVSAIVGPVMRKPIEEYDPFDAPYANAGRLHEAGIKFCFRSDTASNSRNLPFEAAMAVSYGLPEKDALRAVTLTTAEILGTADKMGSLTPGKWANIVIADGSLLQQTTQIKGIMIRGKPYQPESRQTQYYEKYRTRLKGKEVAP